MKTLTVEDIKNEIRNVQDFPKKGILFRDITTALKDADTMKAMVDFMSYMSQKDIDNSRKYQVCKDVYEYLKACE